MQRPDVWIYKKLRRCLAPLLNFCYGQNLRPRSVQNGAKYISVSSAKDSFRTQGRCEYGWMSRARISGSTSNVLCQKSSWLLMHLWSAIFRKCLFINIGIGKVSRNCIDFAVVFLLSPNFWDLLLILSCFFGDEWCITSYGPITEKWPNKSNVI